ISRSPSTTRFAPSRSRCATAASECARARISSRGLISRACSTTWPASKGSGMVTNSRRAVARLAWARMSGSAALPVKTSAAERRDELEVDAEPNQDERELADLGAARGDRERGGVAQPEGPHDRPGDCRLANDDDHNGGGQGERRLDEDMGVQQHAD